MEVKWYGTAAVSVEDKGVKILFDPFVRMNRHIKPNITLEDYMGADAIFATHGHFDHIFSIPDIEKKEEVPVYCTKTPCETLKTMGVKAENLNEIKPGETVSIGHIKIRVYQAKHVTFDAKYVLSVIPQCVVMCPKIFYMTYLNNKMKENGENLGFEVECNGERVFIMGSFGTVPDETYPKDCDMLVLPFGGCTKIPELTAPFITEMHPKSVVITHFDNSFPPATRTVNAKGLKKRIETDHPDINVLIPREFESYEVSARSVSVTA